MTVLRSRKDLEKWLLQQNWLEDAFIDEVDPLPSGNGILPPESARLVFRLQIGGSLVAGERRRIRRLVLNLKGISLFSLAIDGLAPGHCCDGAEVNNDSDAQLSFCIDVPLDLRLACESIVVTESEWDEDVPAWFSEREFFATALGSRLPGPSEWLRIFEERGQLVAWRYWGGPEVNPAEVPRDYEGWYIQRIERISSTSGGLFFFVAKQQHDSCSLALQANEADDRSLWRTCAAYVGSLPNAEIQCGNVILTGTEWLTHLESMKQAESSGA